MTQVPEYQAAAVILKKKQDLIYIFYPLLDRGDRSRAAPDPESINTCSLVKGKKGVEQEILNKSKLAVMRRSLKPGLKTTER